MRKLSHTNISLKNRILVYLVFTFSLALRPNLGMRFGEEILLIVVFLAILYIFSNKSIKFSKSQIHFFYGLTLFSLYIILQSFFTLNYLGRNVRVAFLLNIPTLFELIIINNDSRKVALKAIIYPTILFSFSYLMTLTLGEVLSYRPNVLYLGTFLKDPTITGSRFYDIYFPFTVLLPGSIQFPLGIELGRLTGFSQEPGIFQFIVITSYFGVEWLELQYSRFYKIILLAGLFLTFSTAGFVIFLICLLYKYIWVKGRKKISISKKTLILLIISSIFIALFTTNLQFGIYSKLNSPSVSRFTFIIVNYTKVEQLFIGTGLGSTNTSGINFLSGTVKLGLIGTLIYLVMLGIPLYSLIREHKFSVLIALPALLTGFIAQPIWYLPLMYLPLIIVI